LGARASRLRRAQALPLGARLRAAYEVRPEGHDMQRLLEDAAQRASRYLESIAGRAVRPDPAAVQQLAQLDIPLPAEGVHGEEVLKLLDERVGPATMAMAGPRFFGFVIGGALPVTVAANWLATAWDQNTGYAAPTPGASRLEEIARRW